MRTHQFWHSHRLPLNRRPRRSILGAVGVAVPEAGVDMQFSFPQLIAHAAKTRPLAAGSLVGSGTIANQDESKGSSCLAEKRMLEIIEGGKPVTPFMKFGDTVRIEMFDAEGRTLFGAIEQRVEKA